MRNKRLIGRNKLNSASELGLPKGELIIIMEKALRHPSFGYSREVTCRYEAEHSRGGWFRGEASGRAFALLGF